MGGVEDRRRTEQASGAQPKPLSAGGRLLALSSGREPRDPVWPLLPPPLVQRNRLAVPAQCSLSSRLHALRLQRHCPRIRRANRLLRICVTGHFLGGTSRASCDLRDTRSDLLPDRSGTALRRSARWAARRARRRPGLPGSRFCSAACGRTDQPAFLALAPAASSDPPCRCNGHVGWSRVASCQYRGFHRRTARRRREVAGTAGCNPGVTCQAGPHHAVVRSPRRHRMPKDFR